MKRKILNTENFEVFTGLKPYCDAKKINYPNLSLKLAGKKKNDTTLFYVDELEFNALRTYVNSSGNEFEILNLFNVTVFGGAKEKRALVLSNNKLYFLTSEQTKKYKFDFTDLEINVLKYYENNPNAKLREICQMFNISVGACDRIINLLNK